MDASQQSGSGPCAVGQSPWASLLAASDSNITGRQDRPFAAPRRGSLFLSSTPASRGFHQTLDQQLYVQRRRLVECARFSGALPGCRRPPSRQYLNPPKSVEHETGGVRGQEWPPDGVRRPGPSWAAWIFLADASAPDYCVSLAMMLPAAVPSPEMVGVHSAESLVTHFSHTIVLPAAKSCGDDLGLAFRQEGLPSAQEIRSPEGKQSPQGIQSPRAGANLRSGS